MSTYETIERDLHLPAGAAEFWAGGWAASMRDYPPGGPDFLRLPYIERACSRLRMGREVGVAFRQAAPFFAANRSFSELAWHCHSLMFRRDGPLSARVREWPMPDAALGPAGAMLYAFVFLSGLPYVESLYADRGIPEAVLVATMADLELWMKAHRERHGVWGFSEHKWLVHHVAANLFQIGRLQYQFGRFSRAFHVFRHRRSGVTALLAEGGRGIDGEGRYVHDEADAAAWRTVYSEDVDRVVGVLMSPYGCVTRRLAALPTAAWERVLAADDPVLALHIPAGGPMDFDACGESFAAALRFFGAYYPDRPFRAFTCGSWLLDPQFEGRLQPGSNIVRFLREFHLYPIPGAMGTSTVARVLGREVVDLDRAPQATSLQRAVVAHLRSGGRWHEGGALLFPQDLSWGDAVYRRAFDAGLPVVDLGRVDTVGG